MNEITPKCPLVVSRPARLFHPSHPSITILALSRFTLPLLNKATNARTYEGFNPPLPLSLPPSSPPPVAAAAASTCSCCCCCCWRRVHFRSLWWEGEAKEEEAVEEEREDEEEEEEEGGQMTAPVVVPLLVLSLCCGLSREGGREGG